MRHRGDHVKFKFIFCAESLTVMASAWSVTPRLTRSPSVKFLSPRTSKPRSAWISSQWRSWRLLFLKFTTHGSKGVNVSTLSFNLGTTGLPGMPFCAWKTVFVYKLTCFSISAASTSCVGSHNHETAAAPSRDVWTL